MAKSVKAVRAPIQVGEIMVFSEAPPPPRLTGLGVRFAAMYEVASKLVEGQWFIWPGEAPASFRVVVARWVTKLGFELKAFRDTQDRVVVRRPRAEDYIEEEPAAEE